MTRYILRDGQRVSASTGEPMLTEEQRKAPLALPTVISDIPEYQSPIDGRWITSRSERRDDLARNNCVPYEESMSPTKGRIKNAAFAAKRGLKVSDEFRDFDSSKKTAPVKSA
jgi:hypothetical protein